MQLSKRMGMAALLTVIFMVAGILGGCGSGSKETGAQKQNEQNDIPRVLSLATHPSGTLVNSLGSGVATVIGQHVSSEVKVMPTTGPIEWIPMITSGEVDLGVLNNWDAQMGRAGKFEYEKATGGEGADIMLLCSGTRAMTGVLVAEKSSIRTGQDLKGKRFVGVYTGSGGITAQSTASLANFGLKPEDVDMVSVPGVEAGVRAIIEGRADAVGSASLGLSTINELDAEKGARYLSYDDTPEAVAGMKQFYPCELTKVSPGPSMTGVKEPVNLMMYDFYLVGSAKLSDAAAYAIVKALWEGESELGSIHPRLKDWTKERFVNPNATVPYHPGAIKFYKETGVWTSEMDQVQNNLLAAK